MECSCSRMALARVGVWCLGIMTLMGFDPWSIATHGSENDPHRFVKTIMNTYVYIRSLVIVVMLVGVWQRRASMLTPCIVVYYFEVTFYVVLCIILIAFSEVVKTKGLESVSEIGFHCLLLLVWTVKPVFFVSEARMLRAHFKATRAETEAETVGVNPRRARG